MLPAIRELYAYSAWANARVLNIARQLSTAQFVPDSGCGSIRDTLVHIAGAQWLWVQRWQGISPTEMWESSGFSDIEVLRERWSDLEAETASFVAGLEEADLERIVSYINLTGETWAYPLWQQLLHQANHATQHRSEAALQLTQLGYSPGWLDFLVYQDEIVSPQQTAR